MTMSPRARVESVAEELKARQARVEGHLRQVGEPALRDADDRFLLQQSDEVIQAIALRLGAEIEEINQALRRFDEGRYGVCEFCARPIGAARLSTLPSATRCARCARLI